MDDKMAANGSLGPQLHEVFPSERSERSQAGLAENPLREKISEY